MKNTKKIMAVTLVVTAVVCGSAMAGFSFKVNATNPSNHKNLYGQCQYSGKAGAPETPFIAAYGKSVDIPIEGDDLRISCQALKPTDGSSGAGKGAFSGMSFYERVSDPSQTPQFHGWNVGPGTCTPTRSSHTEMSMVVICG